MYIKLDEFEIKEAIKNYITKKINLGKNEEIEYVSIQEENENYLENITAEAEIN
jgi:hypothetical protein